MLRFVLLLAALLLVVWLALRVAREVRNGDLDWRGAAVAAGFVGLALYLSHLTGISGLPV